MEAETATFTPGSIYVYMRFIIFLPRFPFLYIADCFWTCYAMRRSLQIRNPILSLLLGLSIATFSDNWNSILTGQNFAIFENCWLAPAFVITWLLLNYFPWDLIFRFSQFVSLLFSFVVGFLTGRDLTHGIDLAANSFPGQALPILAIGILFGSGRHIILHMYSILHKQKARTAGPVVFGMICAALFYYYATDYGHLSDFLSFSRDDTRLGIVLGLSLLGFVHFVVRDSSFTAIYNVFGDLIGYIVPFYGGTWIPHRPIVEGTKRTQNEANAG
jgi:hypothetical protein